MARPEIGRRAVVGVGILLLAACRIETDRGEAAPLASSPARDTMRARCPEGLPVLRPTRRRAGREISRILPAPDGILLASPEGLFRVADGRTTRLLPGGRDWALERGVLARLGDGRIDLFDHRPRESPAPRGTLAAGRHEMSIALADGDLFVHSAFHDDALVLRRSLADGAIVGNALPVERNLFRTLLEGPGRLHEDEGTLVSDAERVVHVPAVRDPVTVLGVTGSASRALELAGGRRGEARVDREERQEGPRCRLCIRRIRITGRVTVVPLYAGAALADGVLWLVRMDPPGSSNAVLLRVDLEASAVHAWRLALPAQPTALGVVGDTLVMAADRDLWVASAPPAKAGAACPVVGLRSRS